jgi:hypothetical protein
MGFGAFLGPWRVLGILGKGSSVKLPLDDVNWNVKKVGREDHGYAEGMAIVEEGQEVVGAGLGHHR